MENCTDINFGVGGAVPDAMTLKIFGVEYTIVYSLIEGPVRVGMIVTLPSKELLDAVIE